MEYPSKQRPNQCCTLFSLLLLLTFTTIVSAQENTKNEIGSWMVFSMENQLSEKWSVPLIGILSYENWAEQTEFGFVRTGLTYTTNPNVKLTLGVAYVDSQPLYHHEFETLTTQFWLYQQASLKTGECLKHRLRLENRWIDKPSERVFNVRFRYRLQFKQKLYHTLYVKCTNEPFFNFDELHIDQNRFFLGIGGKVGKDLTMEAGYFKTHVRKDNYDRIRVVLHLNTSFFKRSFDDISVRKINRFAK